MLDKIAGKTGIYHGVINLFPTPSLSANVYAIDTLYMAYPNIAYAGNGPGDNRSIVSVLISSSTIQPGVTAFQIDNNTEYSPLTVVKSGTSYTNMLVGNERFGDYTCCQTRFNFPGCVWINGSYSIVNHTTRTWIGELGVNTGVNVPEISSSDSESSVYANPPQERVSFKFIINKPSNVTFRILTMQGKVIKTVYKGSLSGGENEISMQTGFLPSGNYYVQMHDERGSTVINEKITLY